MGTVFNIVSYVSNDIVSTLIKGQSAAGDIQQADEVGNASVTTRSKAQSAMIECMAYDSIQQTTLDEVSVTGGSRTQPNIIAMNECVAYGSSSADDVEHIYDEMDEVPIVTIRTEGVDCDAHEPTVVPEAGGEHQSQGN